MKSKILVEKLESLCTNINDLKMEKTKKTAAYKVTHTGTAVSYFEHDLLTNKPF